MERTVKGCTVTDCSKPHRARGLCSTHYNDRHQPDRHARRTVACAVCGAAIERAPRGRAYVCSVTCRTILTFGSTRSTSSYDWAVDAVHRAQAAGAVVVEVFDRQQVFDRDGYRCYLCGCVTDPTADPLAISSPTVDHVVPLTKGGQHSLANVRTACLGCNSRKADRPALAHAG